MVGLPAAAAAILATLLIESKPMDLDELSSKTGYAKSHLSSMLRLLEEKLLIEKIPGKSRKVYFKAKRDALTKIIHQHLRRIRNSLRDTLAELHDGLTEFKELERIERELHELIKRLNGDEH